MRSPRRTKPLQITKISNVWMRLVNPKDRKRLLSLLSYEKEWWKDTAEFECDDCGLKVTSDELEEYRKRHRAAMPCRGCNGLKRSFVRKKKMRKTYQVPMVNKGGVLYMGFLPYLQDRFDVELDFNQDSDMFLWRDKISLRPYQMDALVQIGAKLKGQISLPTGTGKTILAAAVLASLPNLRALFVVHTKDLLWQTKKVFEKLLKTKVGIVGDGKVDWKKITIGMIQSLKDYNYAENPVDIVMVDEVHHAGSAETYAELLEKVDCPIRLGFSGTVRKDREGWLKSMGLLGPVLYEYSYQDAVRDGWLAQAHVRILRPKVSLNGVKGNYRQVYNEGIIGNSNRNELIVQEAGRLAGSGNSVLIQVKEVKHGNILNEMFNGGAVYLTGKDDSEVRVKVKELLEAKKVRVCLVSPIFDEGVDIPSLDSIVVAGGGLSEIKAIQKVGRGLRKTEDKDTVEIIDFMDSCHKHLRKHSRERIKIYESKGWIVEKEF